MGNLVFNVDNGFARMIERMDNFDEIAPKMLKSAGGILETYIKRGISKHDETGELYKSIALTVYKSKYGWYALVHPRGYARSKRSSDGGRMNRSDKVPNAQKLMSLEYGTRKQPARPFIQAAINNAANDVERVLWQIYEEEVLNGR